jgi:hypothetical protein
MGGLKVAPEFGELNQIFSKKASYHKSVLIFYVYEPLMVLIEFPANREYKLNIEYL